uniref:SSD domain-containing protein n=1 Tax=Maylandia zebra TaxID=106582 RepID=A0A3P9CTK4_9CICH
KRLSREAKGEEERSYMLQLGDRNALTTHFKFQNCAVTTDPCHCPATLRMDSRRTDCLTKPLSRLFENLGSKVGSYPLYFFIVPVLLSAALSGGFIFLEGRQDNSLERQFTPTKGPSKATRAFVKENFPYNYSMFSEDRQYDKGSFASLIAMARNSRNLLDTLVLEDIISLNNKILDITVDNGRLGFNELCARANGECVSNLILEILSYSLTNQTSITYPVHMHKATPLFLGAVLGGVITDDSDSVRNAEAVKLFYYLDDRESTAEASKLWLREFKKLLSDNTDSEHIYLTSFCCALFHTTDGFPLFLIAYGCAVTVSVISCLRLDNVRNKVWVAVFGILSAVLAVLSGFGLLLYIGVPFVITVANAVFLLLGIGLNNMFIMVSDWRHTHVNDPVPKRMAHTYKEAIMPITITAVTDVLNKSNCIMISCQYGPKSPRNVSSTLNICHDELRQASV